jgi:hypothetical protein
MCSSGYFSLCAAILHQTPYVFLELFKGIDDNDTYSDVYGACFISSFAQVVHFCINSFVMSMDLPYLNQYYVHFGKKEQHIHSWLKLSHKQ